jgi:hypothetical protein
MDSVSLKQIPKFNGERKHFPVWLTKATAVCALNGVIPTLKAGFKDCPQRNKIKCKHCGRLGHTKATCWKLEKNKSKRPEWWTDMAAVTADEVELLL